MSARALCVLIVAALLAAGCSNPKPVATPSATATPTARASATPSAAASLAPTPPPIVVKGTKRGKRLVEISAFSHGRTIYHLFAASVFSDTRTRKGTFQKTHGLFYEKSGRTLTVDAPIALVDQNSKSVTMTGGVNATTTDGAVLTCDQLIYNDLSQTMHGTGNVKLTRAGQVLTGEVIDADLHLDQYKVTGL